MSLKHSGTGTSARTANLPVCNSTGFSLSCWFRVTSYNGNENTLFYLAPTGSADYIFLGINNSNVWFTEVNESSSTGFSFGSQPAAGVWYFLFLTLLNNDATGLKINVYDPRGLPFTNGNSNTSGNCAPGTVNLMRFGNNEDGTSVFNGDLAHGRTWDAVLTQAEMEREMRSPFPRRLTNFNTGFNGRDTGGADIGPNGRNWTVTSVVLEAEMPLLPLVARRKYVPYRIPVPPTPPPGPAYYLHRSGVRFS